MKNLLPTLAAAVMPMLGGCDRCLTSVPCSGSTPALVVVGEVTLDGAPVDALITLFGTDSTELGHWQQWPDEYGPGFRSLGHAIGDVNVCQAGIGFEPAPLAMSNRGPGCTTRISRTRREPSRPLPEHASRRDLSGYIVSTSTFSKRPFWSSITRVYSFLQNYRWSSVVTTAATPALPDSLPA